MTSFFDSIVQLLQTIFSILTLPAVVVDTLNMAHLIVTEFIGSFGAGNIFSVKSWEIAITMTLGLILPLFRDIF